MRRIRIIVLTVLIMIAGTTLLAEHVVGGMIIWAIGNGGGCTVAECVNDILPTIRKLAVAIRGQSTLLATSQELELWNTPYGQFWNPEGNALFWDLAEQSIDVYRANDAGVRRGDIVLDCGANVGTFTRAALRQGASLVVAFDIDPRNIESLSATFAAEIAAGTVIVVPKGVWHREDTLEAKFYSNTNLNTVTMESRIETAQKPKIVKVPLTTIDTVVRDLGLTRVDFIKMDVEGAEISALRGAQTTIERFKPKLSIAVENQPEDIETIPALIRSFAVNYSESPSGWRRIRPWVIRPEAILFVPRQ